MDLLQMELQSKWCRIRTLPSFNQHAHHLLYCQDNQMEDKKPRCSGRCGLNEKTLCCLQPRIKPLFPNFQHTFLPFNQEIFSPYPSTSQLLQRIQMRHHSSAFLSSLSFQPNEKALFCVLKLSPVRPLTSSLLLCWSPICVYTCSRSTRGICPLEIPFPATYLRLSGSGESFDGVSPFGVNSHSSHIASLRVTTGWQANKGTLLPAEKRRWRRGKELEQGREQRWKKENVNVLQH